MARNRPVGCSEVTMSKYEELAKRLYPREERQSEDEWLSFYDYSPMLAHFGKILIQRDDDNYQGDSRVLYADEGKGYGYLQFGWGSCSGCDALQSCSTYEDVGDLIKQLEDSVQWKSGADMLTYFKTHDWESDYSWSEEAQRKFVGEVVELLGRTNSEVTSDGA